MLAEDDQGSGTAVGLGADHGSIAFTTTHWSVVREAQGPSPAAEAALERLCRAYWRPIHAFVMRQGRGPEDAQDLTQRFFALLLQRRDFDAVRQEKGRLRSYLLTALKHFLANERERSTALKRGAGQCPIPLDELDDNDRAAYESTSTWTAEQIYERRWALAVLEQVLGRLRKEYKAAANDRLFGRFNAILTDEPDRQSQAEIALELGMTENAVKQAFHRFRRRYRELLRDEIAQTVMMPGDVKDELRHLIAVLQA